MLQPRRKLTKKEIRRDPLLEYFEKARLFYETNKRSLNTGAIVLVILILLGWGWQNSRSQEQADAMLSSTKAVAAYLADPAGAGVAEELQSLANQYQGKYGTAQSLYFLGITQLDSNQYDAASATFEELVKNTQSPIFLSAATLKLAYIKEMQGDYPGAAALYEQAARTGKVTARNEALIAAGYNYQRAGQLNDARRVVAMIKVDILSSELLDSFRYLQGMVGV